MRLKKVILENFRSYKNRTEIDIDDLTVLVGKNDIGKSTILEALDIFFNESKAHVKIEKNDINIENKKQKNNDIIITCIFDNLPSLLNIEDNTIGFSDSYLTNKEGFLEVRKTYKNANTKYSVELVTSQPISESFSNLYDLTQTELRNIVTDYKLECKRNDNHLMRLAIWNYIKSVNGYENKEVIIDLTKKDFLKETWEGIKLQLPNYMLFRADRENNDEDDEIQNPLKAAVKRVLNSPDVIERLDYIASKVKNEVSDTAKTTLKNVSEIDSHLATGLKPIIPPNDELKWIDVFKNLSIESKNEISLNKRGSGIRRIVLLSFFQAEAENIKKISAAKSIIYAIEEPETAQHIENQILLIKALKDISKDENAQVLLTTHSSAIVRELTDSNIRIITNEGSKIELPKKRCLDWISLNEINYIAFGDYSIEFFNELYGFLFETASKEYRTSVPKGKKINWYTEEDFDKWLETKNIKISKQRIRTNKDGTKNENLSNETLETFIRNLIHHPENRFNPDGYTEAEIKKAIEEMIEITNQLKINRN